MPKHSLGFDAIGTWWSIDTDVLLPEEVVDRIRARVDAFDATYSRFRSDSLVSRISKAAGVYAFPPDAAELFNFYEKLFEITDGKVTPLIGEVLERAGYDAEYSFQAKSQHSVPRFDEVVRRNGSTIEVSEPVLLDVGAAGKGYLVDLICGILDEAGVYEYVVDASGDLRHKGKDENKVGLEHPTDSTKVIGIIDVQNQSLCASAVNRRRWGNGQHHVFDPDTLSPTEDVIATWVIADTAMVADGIATALFFATPEKIKEAFEYEFVRVHNDSAIDASPAFEGKLF